MEKKLIASTVVDTRESACRAVYFGTVFLVSHLNCMLLSLFNYHVTEIKIV